MAAEKERSDLQRDQLELKRRKEDDKVMKIDLSGLSERQRHYYEKMQDENICDKCHLQGSAPLNSYGH